ncbi:MAG: hypothetical protein ACRD1T_25255 [Acidimicrobiia bacterium]
MIDPNGDFSEDAGEPGAEFIEQLRPPRIRIRDEDRIALGLAEPLGLLGDRDLDCHSSTFSQDQGPFCVPT